MATETPTTWAEDYARQLSLLKTEFIDERSLDAHAFKALPTYNIPTSSGEMLTITSYQLHGEGRKTGCLVLVAQNSAGEIVGHQNQTVEEREGNVIIVHGSIFAGKKEIGVTLPLELAQMHLLQEMSTNRNVVVVRQVDNYNLKQLIKRRAQTPPESAEELEPFELEQERWMSVYGPSGKLGVIWPDAREGEPMGYQRFDPKPQGKRELASLIYLEREEKVENVSLGQSIIRVTPRELRRITLSPADTEAFQEQQLEAVRHLLAA